ncbi:MAG: glycine zipper 2TM domain-containing protein [Burkholderiales bacterium]|nr:glycine zipper 2TM domain-containing protein [Opitutaceae bacterium]
MKTTFLALLALMVGSVGAHAQVFRPAVVNGAVLGGIAGAVIGNNSGNHNGAQGALIGAVAGGLLGAAYDNSQRSTGYSVVTAPPPPTVVYEQPAPVYDYRTVEVRTGPTRYVYRPAPVVVVRQAPVVVYRPAPRVVYVQPGYGHRHDRHDHHRGYDRPGRW